MLRSSGWPLPLILLPHARPHHLELDNTGSIRSNTFKYYVENGKNYDPIKSKHTTLLCKWVISVNYLISISFTTQDGLSSTENIGHCPM